MALKKNIMTTRYEPIWNVQTAINMAVAENRVVRFLSSKSNEELRKEILDKKGCKIMKPAKLSDDVAVIPPSITNFVFDEVDPSLGEIWLPSGSKKEE